MTFLALLTKEMRIRMRRERTIWVIVAYILLIGLLGWLVISSSGRSSSNVVSNWSMIGYLLYTLLLIIQIFLILFITPAFTATTINGEKERQTFDLLLCSRLSPFSLIAGKLLAGMMNALLLIAASLPIFSLVFFFGGVSPVQAMQALAVSIVTALVAATLGIFCSAIFQRPAASTAVTYMLVLLWLILPLIIAAMAPVPLPVQANPAQPVQEPAPQLFLMENPIVALMTTFSSPSAFLFPRGNYVIGSLNFAAWQGYILLNIITTVLLFLCSVWLVRLRPMNWQHILSRKVPVAKQEAEATATA
ncbi:MAG: ABC transporter permease subunit [Ktedonobacteraceae bacterium]|nr:ABC transporter permease subunit [Ktedonobacteraceae bacterium]